MMVEAIQIVICRVDDSVLPPHPRTNSPTAGWVRKGHGYVAPWEHKCIALLAENTEYAASRWVGRQRDMYSPSPGCSIVVM